MRTWLELSALYVMEQACQHSANFVVDIVPQLTCESRHVIKGDEIRKNQAEGACQCDQVWSKPPRQELCEPCIVMQHES